MQAKPDEQRETTLRLFSPLHTCCDTYPPAGTSAGMNTHTYTHVNISRDHVSLLAKIKCKLSSRLQSAIHP